MISIFAAHVFWVYFQANLLPRLSQSKPVNSPVRHLIAKEGRAHPLHQDPEQLQDPTSFTTTDCFIMRRSQVAPILWPHGSSSNWRFASTDMPNLYLGLGAGAAEGRSMKRRDGLCVIRRSEKGRGGGGALLLYYPGLLEMRTLCSCFPTLLIVIIGFVNGVRCRLGAIYTVLLILSSLYLFSWFIFHAP
ncbi:hypothetical protein F5B17DRAFT_43154 [Nemania serpens]|nr:hypothetical protein F5B17DRAFT_43154 [Nemania serpens]